MGRLLERASEHPPRGSLAVPVRWLFSILGCDVALPLDLLLSVNTVMPKFCL